MRLVIQRVKKAKVLSKGKKVGEISGGLYVLVGVGREDKVEYADFLARKLVNMRLLADASGKMNLSIKETGGEILVVSQFTLYADLSYGRRPSFIEAAEPNLARKIYDEFIQKIKGWNIKVETGSFGDYMLIESVADGPVTIILDYPSGKDLK